MGIRVLIADDHTLVAEGLRALIASQPGLEVVGQAADGREALRRSLELRPDVLVMDMSMPEMNGIEAARAIRARLPATQVVMVSMHSTPEYVQRALEAGALAYLVKRSASRELIAAIRAAHAGRRYFGENIAESVIERYLGDAAARDPLAVLSARERQVLQLLAESRSVADIARELSLSPKTVETYRSRLFDKLGIRDLPALVRFAIQHGVTPLE
ncbi:MAG: response regulator transcription factor [Burkholderiales bacterium]